MRVLVYLFVFISFVQAQSLDKYLENYKPTPFSELEKYGATVKDIIYQSAVGDRETVLKFLKKYNHRITEKEELNILKKYGVHPDVIKEIEDRKPPGELDKLRFEVPVLKEENKKLRDKLNALENKIDKLKEKRSVPTGTILPFYGKVSQIPKGFLNCNGEQKSKSKYPSLYEHLKSADQDLIKNEEIFDLPNLKGKFLMGDNLPGKVGGATMQNTTIAGKHEHAVVENLPKGGYYGYHRGEGGDHSHAVETLPPYKTVLYIIKY